MGWFRFSGSGRNCWQGWCRCWRNRCARCGPRSCAGRECIRGRTLLGGLPLGSRMHLGPHLFEGRGDRRRGIAGSGLCQGRRERRTWTTSHGQVLGRRQALVARSGGEGFLEGEKESPRVSLWRCGLPERRGRPMARGRIPDTSTRSPAVRVCGKANAKRVEEAVGRDFRRRTKVRGAAQTEGRAGQGHARRQDISFEEEAERGRSKRSSRSQERHAAACKMEPRAARFGGSSKRTRGQEAQQEPQEKARLKRKRTRKEGPQHGGSVGQGGRKEAAGRARTPQVPQPEGEKSQPQEKEAEPQQETPKFERQEVIEISDEEQFVWHVAATSEEGQQGPRFGTEVAAEKRAGGACRSRSRGCGRWEPIARSEQAIGLLPDHLQADVAREGQRRARAGDYSPLSRPPGKWEAGGTGRHPSRPFHCGRVSRHHRVMERRAASRSDACQADRPGAARGPVEGTEAQPPGGKGCRSKELAAIPAEQQLSAARSRSKERRRERGKREERPERKRQRRRKEECLEIPAGGTQRDSKGARRGPTFLDERERNHPTCALGAVESHEAVTSLPGGGTGETFEDLPFSAGPLVNEPLLGESEVCFPSGQLALMAPWDSAGPPCRAVRNLSTVGLAAYTRPQALGPLIAEGILHGHVPSGLESLLKVKRNASSDADSKSRGIFPLPVDWDLVSPPNKSGRAPGVQAWLPLVCHALNSLSGCKKPVPRVRNGKQVVRVLASLESRIERFLGLFENVEEISPVEIWEDVKKKKVSYEGEEIAEPVCLTVKQILKSLPPKGHGGSVELTPLLVGHTKFLMEHPEAVLLGAEEREAGSNKARVHIQKGQEKAVWELLHERGVTEWIRLKDVHSDAGGPFLSGMFGVCKPGKFCEDGSPILRVIMNLKPINRAMRIIQGDIGQLPSPIAWTQIHLGEGETIEVSQADMSSAFYLFRLPRQWLKFLAFNSRFKGHELGLDPAEEYVPACCVLPMGWSSSVGVMQMISRELIRRKELGGADEICRQALVPRWFVDTALRTGPRTFWQVYLDNFMGAEVRKTTEEGGASSRLHEIAVDAWSEAKVLCAKDKHVINSQEAIELGVQLHSEQGLVGGDALRFQKLLGATMMLLQQRLPKVRWVQVVLGRWIFVLQYRRSAMAVLSRCWNYTKAGQDRRRWWPVVKEELTTLLCLAPLLHSDVRTSFNPLVTCSDASHFGGAVAVSEGTTCAGAEAALRLQDLTLEPVCCPLLVISAFNGIGGAFRGYDLAGVKPAGLIAIEWDKAAQRTTRKAWPQTMEYGDIQKISRQDVQEWANLFPRVTHVQLIGGFPCVHLSAARAGRLNLQGDGSRLFWELKQLLGWIEESFSGHAQVDFIIENVLSMDVSARQEISRQLGVEPIALCPSDCLPYNRPRLAWCSMELYPTAGTWFEQAADHVKIHMEAPGVNHEQWLEPGWTRTSKEAFPTFMKAIRRNRPPPSPAGIYRCDPACLESRFI